MSGDFPFAAKIVSPAKCNEKPWDLWVNEIGHSSPQRDEEAAGALKAERGQSRRTVLHRLHYDSMSLHGLFPQMDNLNAAVCHMCGVIVKCSAVYRHLIEFHTNVEPIRPPPPPAPTVKLKSVHSRSRHKKELVPPPPLIEVLPVKIDPPVHTAPAPLSRIVLPQPEVQFLDEASTSATVPAEVQVCVETGELPVVSIQDTEDLPLGENLTDDIFAIMNSEGIQTADDITNSVEWKSIIRDIGNMQDINFSQPNDPGQTSDAYAALEAATLPAYALADVDLAALQFAPPPAAPLPEPSPVTQPPRPAAARTPSRTKSSKTKFNTREYDPNKHCGVVTVDNPRPCTRSLTCKAHALSLRRLVEGRVKPFDTLLAEHRASRDAAAAPPPALEPPPPEPRVEPPPPAPAAPPAAPWPEVQMGAAGSEAPAPVAAEVCWYSSSPRPLALCTFNAAHAAGVITLGKRFATVRSNIKSALSRAPARAAGRGGARAGVRRLVAVAAAPRPNGHVRRLKERRALLDLDFALDPLLADEKC